MAGFSDNTALLTLKKQKADEMKEQQQKNLEEMKDGLRTHIGKYFVSRKNGVQKRVYLEEVKRKDVVIKRSPDAKDSRSESIARFNQEFQPEA